MRSITRCCESGIEFQAGGVAHAADIAREFDDRALHAQAQTQEGDVFFARVADGRDLSFDAAVAEPAGHQDAVAMAEQRLRAFAASISSASTHCRFTVAWLAMPPWRSASYTLM